MSLRRSPVPARARSVTQQRSLPAPVLGWVSAQNQSAARPGTALVMENWFPTETGVRLIGGSAKFATVSDAGEPCESLMAYTGPTKKLFAASDGNIFDITTPADADAEGTPSVEGQTSDYYSYANWASASTYYMYAVNGTDAPRLFEGTYWYPVGSTNLYTLAYDAESAPFAVGETLTGGTSGAVGTIVHVIDGGTTGTLWINAVTGTFQNDETITDSATGSATVNGTATQVGSRIVGVTSSTLSHVNPYRNRLYFVQVNTLKVWATEANSLGGTMVEISLAGVVRKGGAVLFTATWSLDAGDGLDDKLVIVTDQGEVAVYQGSDPSDSDTWSLVGLYDCPPPLGKNAYMRAGGDLVILTQQGAVPVSQIIIKDPAALQLAAISKAIQPDWMSDADDRSTKPWEVVKWPSRSMGIISNPVTASSQQAQCYIVNLETGAWCKRTGWDAMCFALHQDQVYFGTSDGLVMQADTTGADDGDNYECNLVMAWDHLNAPGAQKSLASARAQFTAATEFNPQLSASTDYTVSLPTPPNVTPSSSASGVWDSGVWDTATWDSGPGATRIPFSTRWVSMGQTGYVHALQLQVTMGGAVTPNVELASMDLLYEAGEVMV